MRRHRVFVTRVALAGGGHSPTVPTRVPPTSETTSRQYALAGSASRNAFMKTKTGDGVAHGATPRLVSSWLLVTCWLVPAAAASCRRETRCSRRPCSGPCTWQCTSGDGMGKHGSIRPLAPRRPPTPAAHRPSQEYASARLPNVSPRRRRHFPAQPSPYGPGPLTRPHLLRVVQGAPRLSDALPETLISHPLWAEAKPQLRPPLTPRYPRARRVPYLQQLLRVGHGDLHLHLLHDEPRVQLPAAGAPEIGTEAALHGSSVNRAAATRADPQPPEARPFGEPWEKEFELQFPQGLTHRPAVVPGAKPSGAPWEVEFRLQLPQVCTSRNQFCYRDLGLEEKLGHFASKPRHNCTAARAHELASRDTGRDKLSSSRSLRVPGVWASQRRDQLEAAVKIKVFIGVVQKFPVIKCILQIS